MVGGCLQLLLWAGGPCSSTPCVQLIPWSFLWSNTTGSCRCACKAAANCPPVLQLLIRAMNMHICRCAGLAQGWGQRCVVVKMLLFILWEELGQREQSRAHHASSSFLLSGTEA